jgi:YVTN family beta-propeller protein
MLAGCGRGRFPDVPAGYHEFAYVSNGGSNTVSVLDLVYLRQDRTLQVGVQPSGMAVNPKRDEVYVVNTGTAAGVGSVSVIDTDANRVVATIPVHKLPYAIDVDAAGRRAYVANSGSNTVSVIDLDRRREVGVIGTGELPGLARISPDMRTLVVTNRGSNSVSVFAVAKDVEEPKGVLKLPGLPASAATKPAKEQMPTLRAAFPGCMGATDAVILPDSSKAFIACSNDAKVMAISLAAAPGSWAAEHNGTLLTDHMLTLLDVGQTPVHLALKPDGGEIFCSNFGSDSVSEIEVGTNEVGGTYTIANRPVFSVVGADNSTLWVHRRWPDGGERADGARAGCAGVLGGPASAACGRLALWRRDGDPDGGQERAVAVYDPAGGGFAECDCGEGDAGEAVRERTQVSEARPGAPGSSFGQFSTVLRRRALAMTETELRLMAAAASIGLSSRPKAG